MFRIKDFISLFQKPPEGKTIITAGENREEFSYANYEIPEYERLEAASRNYSVFASLNLLSQSIYGSGFTLSSDNKKVLSLCEPVQKIKTFSSSVLEGILNTLRLGDGYVEIIWDGNSISNFKLIDSKTMEPKWDKKGIITHYLQKVPGSARSIKLEKDEVCFFRFFRIGDNVHGIGLVEPVFRLLEIRNEMFEAIADIFKYLAMPPVHIIKEGAKTRSELLKAEEQFKDFHRKSYWITNEKYKMALLEIKKNLPELSKYFEIINSAIATGLRVPSKILSGDISVTAKASAGLLKEMSADEIGFIRSKLSSILEEQIYLPLCLKNGFSEEDVPRVVWKPDVAEDPKLKSEVLINKTKVISELLANQLATREELQEKISSLMEKL